MSSITLFFLFAVLSASEVRAQNNDSSIIKLGSSLSPKTNSTPLWFSPSGRFSFGFYQQQNGFAVGIRLKGEDGGTIVWTPNSNDRYASSDSSIELKKNASSDSVIELTEDGLLLRNEPRQMGVLIAKNGSETTNSASMLDSGNFVLYNKNNSVIWQSFDHPSDTILGGQSLSYRQELISANGHFGLVMNVNGFVAYPMNSETEYGAYWRAFNDIYDPYSYLLTLNLSGFLCLIDRDDENITKVVANTSNYLGRNTSLIIYRATLDLDGNFRLYLHTSEKNTSFKVQRVWQSNPDQCEVKGFCGFNSYCSMNGSEAVCKCYPGFKPVNGNKSMFLDCQQEIKDGCKTSEDPKVLYNVVPLPNVQWDLSPYLAIPLEMKACEKSCKEDCDCGAVLYEDGNCKKYRLPLIFGRINHTGSTTALFKLPTSTNIVIPSKPTKLEIIVDDKKNLILTLVITLGSMSFLCLAFAISMLFIYMHKVHSYTKLSASSEKLGFAEDCSVRTFAFEELVNSTGNFTEQIGRGSFGVVYKGTISGNNRRIAVKKLDDVVQEGEREFQAEITAIARTHHRNLVQFIGYCIDGSRKLLVYEYMSNGSLAEFLFKAEMHLSWKQRVKIALDVARGVLYLHEECEVCIVLCNIKPQNILLDEMWTAKISDFGLSRLSMPEHSRATTLNESTSGYVAPERQKEALTSVKVDVFSYGVMLLEIICCRRNISVNVASEEEIMLSSWVYNCFVKGELKKLAVDEDVEWRTLERMVKVALWCVQEDLSLRPSMKNVILMLEGLKDIPTPPSPVPLT